MGIMASKYKNIKTVIDNIKFDSKREAMRYLELKQWQKEARISDLRMQVDYNLMINGKFICKYRPDFVYTQGSKLVVEDVKSNPTKTPVYRLKKKLMYAIYGIEINEVQ